MGTVETMTAAFKIIMGDPNVKSIFVNIFGGIARCDNIATAVVAGVQAVGGNDAIKPLVIRLEGTNVEQGMKIINESGVNASLRMTSQQVQRKPSSSRSDHVLFFSFF